MKVYPSKGEYIYVSLDPTKGHEQAGRRPALVVSSTLYNRKTGLAQVLPITHTTTGPTRFIIPDGEPVDGAVLWGQIRTVDLEARSWESIGYASDDVLEEAVGKSIAILSED